MTDAKNGKTGGYRFGTIAGVFLPNILAILGVILFLRTGWVVGNAGLGFTLVIIVLAHFVTLTTGLAIAALSTNMTVKTGGAYYIISRSLGIEIGGCIGIPLAFSQILSIPFYLVGFAESVVPLLPGVPEWAISGTALVLVALLSLRGTDVAIKAQYVVAAGIALALVSVFAGAATRAPVVPEMWGSFGEGDFWMVFAVFFPAVTGIMSGVSMSGDLADPRKSIPRGTMAAVFVGLVIYLVVAVFLAFYATPEQLLRGDVVSQVAAWSPLIYVGIWCATLSSALGFILGAPRTTQAVAQDGVLPRVLARVSGPNREPRVALWFSLGCAVVVLAFGNLNAIAAVLSMFFLATYGMLNLVAGLETLVDNPSYRPRIKVPWWISILGALSCFAVMFLIDAIATVVALSAVAGIYLVLKKRKLDAAWGDLRRGIWMALIRRALLQMEQYPARDKNWRPNIVALTEIPQGRLHLVEFAHWFGQRSSVVTIRHLLVGPRDKLLKRRKVARNNLSRFIRENDLLAFGAVDIVGDRSGDLRLLLESQGYGSFQSNAVMVDWAERAERGADEFGQMVTAVIDAEKTLLLLHADVDRAFGAHDSIDLWPETPRDAALMLILADLLLRNPVWRDARLRYFELINNKDQREQVEQEMQRVVASGRIPCAVEAVLRTDSRAAEMARRSSGTALVLGSFDSQTAGEDDPFATAAALLEGLPSTLLVKSASGLDVSA